MIRLQIGISNLRQTNYQQEIGSQISFKFGSISTKIDIVGGCGGKSLVLELSQQEMQEMYSLYACGLFLETGQGRYFSLLDLRKLRVGERVICQQIWFSNDVRQTKFKCQFSIVTNVYKTPKIANLAKIQQRDNVLNLNKKPAIPKQATLTNNFVQINKDKNKPISFLYGGKQKQQEIVGDHLRTMKEDLRHQNQIKKNLQKNKELKVMLPKQAFAKKPEAFDQNGDFLDFGPPVMEFTNDEQNQGLHNMRVPQVQHMEYADSLQQQNRRNAINSIKVQTEPKFATFNRNNIQNSGEKVGNQTPSQFDINNQNLKFPPKAKPLSKQQIKELARKQAQQKMQRNSKDKMCVPVVKGQVVSWVPLAKLKPEQIIDFVHRQRKNQQQAQENERKKRELQRKQLQLKERSRKLQLDVQRRERQRLSLQRQASYQKKTSKQIRGSVKEMDEEQSEQQKIEQQQEYMSDFESASVTGSIIKSRVSSRGGVNYKNVAKQQQSMVEDEYSAEFDSYSQSMLSKGNKNRNKVVSVSDYSDSYRSISQSYRKG